MFHVEHKQSKVMKNTDIKNLEKEVPVKIRLEVYKEAITLIESGRYKFGMNSFGLCLILPCILWDLNSYLRVAPNNRDWSYNSTSIAFPELTQNVISEIERVSYRMVDREAANNLRVAYLKEWIENLSN